MPLSSDPAGRSSREALERESYAWANRLSGGAVTPEDAESFKEWRARSPAHDASFVEAIRFQRAVRTAVLVDRAATRADMPRSTPRAAVLLTRRRALFAGGGLAAAAAGVYAVIEPPANLWPSLAALTSDVRTATGEQRNLTPAAGVSVALNTQTAISLHGSSGAASGLRLIAGEAGLTVDRPHQAAFVVAAGVGRTLARQANFDIRDDGREVRVTCLEGQLDVAHPKGRRRLLAGQGLRYSGARLGVATATDIVEAAAWRQGVLIFRDAPLQQIVEELNRYRPGRIVLLDPALGRRQVYAVFQLKHLSKAVDQVSALTGARQTALPGGVVILS